MMDGSFRRNKPQLRKKRESSSEDEQPAKKPSAVVETKKPMVQKGLQIGSVGIVKTEKKGLSKGLSFDDEEEAGIELKKRPIKVKAEDEGSSSAYTFGKSTEKAAAMSSYYSNTSYSADELAALTKNAKSLGAASTIRLAAATHGAGGADIAGSASHKKRKDKHEDNLDAPVKIKGLTWAAKAETADGDDGEDDGGGGFERPRVRVEEENKLAAAQIRAAMAGGGGPGGAGLIPSEDQIQQLKARREQARKFGGGGGGGGGGRLAREFIPLDETADEGKSGNNRLIREDIEDEEDALVADDTGGPRGNRMAFGQGGTVEQRRRAEMRAAVGDGGGARRREVGIDDGSASDGSGGGGGGGGGGDSDDAGRDWEEQQIRKGAAAGPDKRRQAGPEPDARAAANGRGGAGRRGGDRYDLGGGGAGGPRTMDDVQAILQEHLGRIKAQHAQDAQALKVSTARVEQGRAAIDRTQREIKIAEGKYTFFQEMRCFLEDLLECLDAKAPLIEDIEDAIVLARRDRGEAVKKRRQTDLQDELLESREQVGKATGNAWAIKGEAQLDEFGRDPAMARQRRIRDRSLRRERTLARRRAEQRGGGNAGGAGWRDAGVAWEAAGPTGPVTLEEEMWTTDESDGEVAEWRRRRDEALKTADGVLSDVVQEFRSLAAIYSRMIAWQKTYPKAYKEAWVSLSLPRLLAPHVRLESVRWEPIDAAAPVESLAWVSALFHDAPTAAGGSDEAEDDLIPRLVEQVLVPRVKAEISSAWDPASSRATLRAVAVLQDVMVYILDAAPEAAKALCAAATAAIQAELQAHSPALALLALGDAPTAGRPAYALGRRAFLRCCKLFRNAAALRDIVSPVTLQAITIDKALKDMLLPFLQTLRATAPSDAQALGAVLLKSVPDEWRGSPFLGAFLAFHRTVV